MHPPDIRQKFIELRAAGLSFAKISSSLVVADSTLRLWDHQYAVDIARLRRANWEDSEVRVGLTLETRMRRMAEWINTAEDELEKRQFDLMNNRDLFRFLRMAREEFFRCRRILFNAEHVQQKTERANKIAAQTLRRLTSSKLVADDVRSQVTSQGMSTSPKRPSANTARHSKTPPPPAAEAHDTIATTNRDLLSHLPLGEGQGEGSPSSFGIDSSLDIRHSSLPAPNPQPSPKIGASADFSSTEPRNTNDLQKPKSESADFSDEPRTSPVPAPSADAEIACDEREHSRSSFDIDSSLDIRHSSLPTQPPPGLRIEVAGASSYTSAG